MIAKVAIDLNDLHWNFEGEKGHQLLIDFKAGKLEPCFMNDLILLMLNTEFLLHCSESFIYQDLLKSKFVSFSENEFAKMKQEVLIGIIEENSSTNYFTNCFVRNQNFYDTATGQNLEKTSCKPCCIYIDTSKFVVFILDDSDADYFLN